MGLENPLHIAFLLIMLLLVFGAKRLPEMGRSLGSGMRGFKDSLSGEHEPATEHEQAHELGHEHDRVAAIAAELPAAPGAGTEPAAQGGATTAAVRSASASPVP
jgi:sec-independent protein translocase protein TatA